MLRFLQSIFGGVEQGRYPESLVKAAIERAVDGTDPWLRALSGYKKKLRPAVVRAIDHVVALVNALPSPIAVSSGSYGSDPRLKAFFMSTAEMRQILGSDRNLADFLKEPAAAASQVIALLMMEMQERVGFGVALSGDVVVHDVPQVTVSFVGHRLIDPSENEEKTRRQLMRRAYDHLLSIALGRIAIVKGEREDLERRRALLNAKLDLLQRGGWGFDETGSAGVPPSAALEEQLAQIEAELEEVGGDDRMLDVYLGIVADVLGRPEEYLWSGLETLIVDRLGIKRSEPADDAPELTLGVLYNSVGQNRVVTLVALPGEELRRAPG
ncbi:hypothetical protein [Geotalea uraniireducens]|uniref:Uncharacterized protein n=1 Tax=Geotalea uraniireducens (strain Rf4) TaxID=351605 RepID=A5G4W7_GEOUR|nr:hypothetical protein [Geotalea uraniireducens]ABQ26835.1 hypothetical protein Gura_2660 [Geotalea uraniireducens Rf4]